MADTPSQPSDPNRLSVNDLRRRLLKTPAATEPAPPPAETEEPDPRQSVPISLLRKLATKPVHEPLPAAEPVYDEPVAPIRSARRSSTHTPTHIGTGNPATDSGVVSFGVNRQVLEQEGHLAAEPLSSSSKRLSPVEAEFERLTQENGELRHLLDEMRQLIADASSQEQNFLAQQQAYESAIHERDNQIAQLQAQFAEIEQQLADGTIGAAPPPKPKTRTELEEWADELEKESFKLAQERRALESDRMQLREDEMSLEKQMREMEVQMARERAMLARQETELRRLNEEIQRELELMQRGDAGLREQLAKFQRRHQEVMSRGGQAPAPPAGYMPAPSSQPGPSQQTPAPNKDSGLVRRLFGNQGDKK